MVFMFWMAAVVSAWRSDEARLNSFPGMIDPGVTIVLADGGVVALVNANRGVNAVPWGLMGFPSVAGVFTFAMCSRSDLRALTASSWVWVAEESNDFAPSAS